MPSNYQKLADRAVLLWRTGAFETRCDGVEHHGKSDDENFYRNKGKCTCDTATRIENLKRSGRELPPVGTKPRKDIDG